MLTLTICNRKIDPMSRHTNGSNRSQYHFRRVVCDAESLVASLLREEQKRCLLMVSESLADV
jgi:hypothetical protein